MIKRIHKVGGRGLKLLAYLDGTQPSNKVFHILDRCCELSEERCSGSGSHESYQRISQWRSGFRRVMRPKELGFSVTKVTDSVENTHEFM